MPELVKALHHDPFSPVLFNSPALDVTEEQRQYMWEVLQTGASDSRFAQKMYNAVIVILTVGSIKPPVVSSLNPPSAAIGSQSFELHVLGSEFGPYSKIIWNGSVEPTTFVNDGELSTLVNMATAENPMLIPVQVQQINGVMSNTMMFDLTSAVPGVLGSGGYQEKKFETVKK